MSIDIRGRLMSRPWSTEVYSAHLDLFQSLQLSESFLLIALKAFEVEELLHDRV